MFEQDGKQYDCIYCHNVATTKGCIWGALQSEEAIHTIDFEGSKITLDPRLEIRPGDTFIWHSQNTGWHLLTCRSVEVEHHFIIPVEMAYAPDTWKAAKVVAID